MLPVLPARLVLCPADNPWPLAPSQAHMSRAMASRIIRSSQRSSLVVRGCCPPQPRRELGAGPWATTSREGRSEALQMSRRDNDTVFLLQTSANVACVHSMKLFLYTKRISAAVRQMEGAFGRAEMSGTACVRKHARGKNKIHYCAMEAVW